MKALFIKDLRIVMKQQRFTLILFLGVIILLTFATDNPFFGIAYLLFLIPTILLSTIGYDAFENGMAYLMALPVSRKTYVKEKYVLAVGGSFIINVVASVLTFLLACMRGMQIEVTDVLICSLLSQILVLIYSALILPVNLRYGTEKGRVIMIIMAVCIGASGPFVSSLAEEQNSTLLALMERILRFGLVNLLLAILFLCIVFVMISYYVAVKWLEKKEY